MRSVVCLLSLVAMPAFADDATEEVPLAYKVHYKWDLVLPAPRFEAVQATLLGFDVKLDGTGLEIDSDGDGEHDIVARSRKPNDKSIVKLRRDGRTWAVRLVNRNGWKYAPSGAAVGAVSGTPVSIIDQDNNGKYNDFGKDAMIVGASRSASFLSRVVNVGGQLYEIDVDAGGTTLKFAPYAGERGRLDLVSKFQTSGKLMAAVVQSADGRCSFELAGASDGLDVPAGLYRIVSGLVGKARERMLLRTGRAQPIRVAAGKTCALSWGGPLTMEYAYERRGDTLTFAPNRIWYYGTAGEEYYGLFPKGRPPEFVISDPANMRELTVAKFCAC